MSLFDSINRPGVDPGHQTSTNPPAPRPVQDPSQKPAAPQHSSAAESSTIGSEIAVADSMLAELDGTRPRMRPLAARPATGHPIAPPTPEQVAIVPVPEGCYVAGFADNGKPIIRDEKTKALVKGSGALPGAGKGRAPGLAKMVRDIVHIPGIIQFLQDVAVGKLAAGAKMADRIKAAEILLDRGYGKPTQHVELKDETTQSEVRKQVEAMTTKELAATVDKLRGLVAQKTPISDAELVDE